MSMHCQSALPCACAWQVCTVSPSALCCVRWVCTVSPFALCLCQVSVHGQCICPVSTSGECARSVHLPCACVRLMSLNPLQNHPWQIESSWVRSSWWLLLYCLLFSRSQHKESNQCYWFPSWRMHLRNNSSDIQVMHLGRKPCASKHWSGEQICSKLRWRVFRA